MSDKLSLLVESQIPEWIREESPTFVRFLEAYYEYLEQEKNPQDILQNLRRYTDIDETLDDFVDHFRSTYLDGLPNDIAADKRLLVKHIRALYQTKGSEKSYALLFRILFNEDVEIYYPRTNILRTSDGKWVQNLTLKVKPVSGDPYSMVGNVLKTQNDTGFVQTEIVDVQPALNGLVEIYISRNYNGAFAIGDEVHCDNGFVGVVQPTTIGFDIVNPGRNFKLGQIFRVDGAGGVGTTVKITKVDSNGGIVAAKIVSFGAGYSAPFYIQLANPQPLLGNVTPFTDFTHGMGESGYITKADYFDENFSDATYSAEVLGAFTTNVYLADNEGIADGDSAILFIKLGALCKYEGYFATTDGFLSDSNRLQDNFYYQNYSYVIRSSRKLEEYKTFVKEILHPAGMKMFGEYQITNDLDLGDFLQYDKVVLQALLFKDFTGTQDDYRFDVSKVPDPDSVDGVDLDPYFFVGKYVDPDSVSPPDTQKFDVTKVADPDSYTTTDDKRFDVTKVPNPDSVSGADSTSMYVTKTASPDSVTSADSSSFATSKVASPDAVDTTANESVSMNVGKTATPDSVTSADSNYFNTNKVADPDSVTSADSAPVFSTGKVASPDSVDTTANETVRFDTSTNMSPDSVSTTANETTTFQTAKTASPDSVSTTANESISFQTGKGFDTDYQSSADGITNLLPYASATTNWNYATPTIVNGAVRVKTDTTSGDTPHKSGVGAVGAGIYTYTVRCDLTQSSDRTGNVNMTVIAFGGSGYSYEAVNFSQSTGTGSRGAVYNTTGMTGVKVLSFNSTLVSGTTATYDLTVTVQIPYSATDTWLYTYNSVQLATSDFSRMQFEPGSTSNAFIDTGNSPVTVPNVAITTNKGGISDTSTQTDSYYLNIGKAPSDTSSPTDSGSVYLANYWIDFGQPDYAGTTILTF